MEDAEKLPILDSAFSSLDEFVLLEHAGKENLSDIFTQADFIITDLPHLFLAAENPIFRGLDKKESLLLINIRYQPQISFHFNFIPIKMKQPEVMIKNIQREMNLSFEDNALASSSGVYNTERKRWEEELFEISERNKIIVENAAVGIALISPPPQNRIIQANRMFSRLLAYKEDEIQGVYIDSLTHPEDTEIDKEIHNGLMDDGKKVFYFEKRVINKKGNIIWITGSAALIADTSGRPLYEILVIEDITDEKKREDERKELIAKLESAIEKEKISLKSAEETNVKLQFSNLQLRKTQNELKEALDKAEEAGRLKTEFLAIMSHELRTPLASLLGFSQLLCEDPDLAPKQKEFANYAYKSGQRLLNLLNSLIDISLLEAGKSAISCTEFDIEKLVEDLFILYKDKLAQKKLLFSHDLHQIQNIKSDPSRIRLILLNLIGNAIKFTEKGSVRLELESRPGGYLFSVSDTGIGVSPEKKKIIFEAFRQSEDPSRRRYEGAGLGLSVCKKLVETLDGEIWVEEAPEGGSLFRFYIPEALITEEAIPAPHITPAQSKQKTRILFAEDDNVNYLFFEEIMNTHSEEYEYKGFCNGQDLFDEYKSNPPYDVILLDIEMPVMNGIKCLEEIRKINQNIPVIAITAFAMSSDREKYISLGFTDYLSKPLKIKTFFDLIRKSVSS